MNALRRWLKSQGRGSAKLLAERVGVAPRMIYDASEGRQRLPHAVAQRVSRKTGLSMHDLPHARTIVNEPKDVANSGD